MTVACRQPEAPAAGYTVTATVKDLMLSLIDPSADVVWESVGTIVSDQGIVETAPRTDEDWANVRNGVLRLAEATNLLMMPGRAAAAPGEKSVAPGVELEPLDIEDLINSDREAWNARARALLDATLKALRSVDARDSQALFDVGEQIEMACEGCHSHFWYPNQPLPSSLSPSRPDGN